MLHAWSVKVIYRCVALSAGCLHKLHSDLSNFLISDTATAAHEVLMYHVISTKGPFVQAAGFRRVKKCKNHSMCLLLTSFTLICCLSVYCDPHYFCWEKMCMNLFCVSCTSFPIFPPRTACIHPIGSCD